MLIALAALAIATAQQPTRLNVAVASNFKPAMEEIEKAFEATGAAVDVSCTYGASGTFVAQIRNGAPFDVFFSADREYPAVLIEAGLARREDEVLYALGRLVLWVSPASTLDIQARGLAVLTDTKVRKVAIANPAVAPYGRAAEAALRRQGLFEKVSPKLVRGQNVSQTAQFAQSGAADAALIPLSLALSPGLRGGRWVAIPAEWHPRIEQSVVIISRNPQRASARALIEFVTGEHGRAVLRRHGYDLP